MLLFSIILIALLLMILSVWIGAVYVPSVDWAIEEMIDIANIKKGEKVVDLGAGNGKILIALARKGIEAHGYEINPLLVLWSWFLIWKAGAWGKAHAHWGNIFSVDVTRFDVIFIFVVPYIMPKLEKKLQKELHTGARVVVETFPFKNWQPIQKTKSVYLYQQVS